MANNVVHTIDDNKLHIIIDLGPKALAAAPDSQSGKTKLVASSSGQIAIPAPKGWTSLTFAINVMGKK